MANGKVCTGFSKPYVAIYNYSDGTITYSNGQILARGVEVSIEPESSDATNFYADNVIAETIGGQFLAVSRVNAAEKEMLHAFTSYVQFRI